MIRATQSTLNREQNESGSDITAVAAARRNMTRAAKVAARKRTVARLAFYAVACENEPRAAVLGWGGRVVAVRR
jgi:hypothetical protein